MNIFGLNEEEVKSRIIFRVDNYEKLKEKIQEQDCVHEKAEDLVKLYGIDLTGVRAPELPDPEKAVSVIALTNEMVRALGIDLREVKDLALENMRRRTCHVQQYYRDHGGLDDVLSGYRGEDQGCYRVGFLYPPVFDP